MLHADFIMQTCSVLKAKCAVASQTRISWTLNQHPMDAYVTVVTDSGHASAIPFLLPLFPFHSFHSVESFHSIPFHSIPFHSSPSVV